MGRKPKTEEKEITDTLRIDWMNFQKTKYTIAQVNMPTANAFGLKIENTLIGTVIAHYIATLYVVYIRWDNEIHNLSLRFCYSVTKRQVIKDSHILNISINTPYKQLKKIIKDNIESMHLKKTLMKTSIYPTS